MKLHIKLSSTLRKYVKGYNPYTGMDMDCNIISATPALIADSLGIPASEIKFVMINGRQLPQATLLKEGDRIAIFPAVGGG